MLYDIRTDGSVFVFISSIFDIRLPPLLFNCKNTKKKKKIVYSNVSLLFRHCRGGYIDKAVEELKYLSPEVRSSTPHSRTCKVNR